MWFAIRPRWFGRRGRRLKSAAHGFHRRGGAQPMQFRGKVAAVTGAAKGIGEATARAFAREGAKVALLDVDDARGRDVAASLGDCAAYFRCDVSRAADVAAAFESLAARFGNSLHYLINNAGVQHYGTVTET